MKTKLYREVKFSDRQPEDKKDHPAFCNEKIGRLTLSRGAWWLDYFLGFDLSETDRAETQENLIWLEEIEIELPGGDEINNYSDRGRNEDQSRGIVAGAEWVIDKIKDQLK